MKILSASEPYPVGKYFFGRVEFLPEHKDGIKKAYEDYGYEYAKITDTSAEFLIRCSVWKKLHGKPGSKFDL